MEISGAIDGLIGHLPPGSTLEELNQAAKVIEELEACSEIGWRLAFAALEAELPGTMDGCCRMIRDHKTYEFLPFPFLETETYAHYHLEQAGLSVPDGLASGFNLRTGMICGRPARLPAPTVRMTGLSTFAPG